MDPWIHQSLHPELDLDQFSHFSTAHGYLQQTDTEIHEASEITACIFALCACCVVYRHKHSNRDRQECRPQNAETTGHRWCVQSQNHKASPGHNHNSTCTQQPASTRTWVAGHPQSYSTYFGKEPLAISDTGFTGNKLSSCHATPVSKAPK